MNSQNPAPAKPAGQSTPNPNMTEKTPVTGIRGSRTNLRIKGFAKAILRMEEEDPVKFQENLTAAINKKRENR